MKTITELEQERDHAINRCGFHTILAEQYKFKAIKLQQELDAMLPQGNQPQEEAEKKND